MIAYKNIEDIIFANELFDSIRRIIWLARNM